jgi:hypothetical protein
MSNRQKYVLPEVNVPAVPPRQVESINQMFTQALYYHQCEITLAKREARQWQDPLHAWLWDDHR